MTKRCSVCGQALTKDKVCPACKGLIDLELARAELVSAPNPNAVLSFLSATNKVRAAMMPQGVA